MIRPEHVGVVLGVALLFPLQAALDAHPGQEASVLITLPPERILPALACGHGTSLADLLEIRAVDYVFQNLRPGGLLERDVVVRLYGGVTALDPQDPGAVCRGALMLGALSDRPDDALALLDRGLARVAPEHRERWRLYWEQAALHLTSLAQADPQARLEHVREAGRLLLLMAQQPGVQNPEVVRSWGTRLSTRGLSPLQALEQEVLVWTDQAGHAEGQLKQRAEDRLHEAQCRLERARLQARLDAFMEHTGGRPPARLQQLGQVPDDPLGVGFYLHEGRIVAPAADARELERRLEKALQAWRERGGSGVPTLDALQVGPIPVWVQVQLTPSGARVTPQPGALDRPPGD